MGQHKQTISLCEPMDIINLSNVPNLYLSVLDPSISNNAFTKRSRKDTNLPFSMVGKLLLLQFSKFLRVLFEKRANILRNRH
jgi:hypothetical protein